MKALVPLIWYITEISQLVLLELIIPYQDACDTSSSVYHYVLYEFTNAHTNKVQSSNMLVLVVLIALIELQYSIGGIVRHRITYITNALSREQLIN